MLDIVPLETDLHTILFFLLFCFAVYLIYKGIQFALKALIFGIAAGLFPILANHFFEIGIPITPSTIFLFVVGGIVIFLAGNFIKKLFSLLKILLWLPRKLFGKSEKTKLRDEILQELKKKEKT
jgi:predicted membrane protein